LAPQQQHGTGRGAANTSSSSSSSSSIGWSRPQATRQHQQHKHQAEQAVDAKQHADVVRSEWNVRLRGQDVQPAPEFMI
jgi:hypothetical protein